MVRVHGVVAAMLVAAFSASGVGALAAPPDPSDPPEWCMGVAAVSAVRGDPNAVVVRARIPSGDVSAHVTAFGSATMSTGEFTNPTPPSPRPGATYSIEFTARGSSPIEAVTIAPSETSCVLRGFIDPHGTPVEPTRITVPLSAETSTPPLTCSTPYAYPRTVQASQPENPYAAITNRITGTVRVAVTLDERGKPVRVRTISTPSAILTPPAEAAARRSQFSPAIFRCEPVRSVYLFTVEYAG